MIIGRVYRVSLPEDERLSEPELAATICATGVHAPHLPAVDDIVRVVVDEAIDGDLVVVMSNGAFGGIHTRLLQSLAGTSSATEGG